MVCQVDIIKHCTECRRNTRTADGDIFACAAVVVEADGMEGGGVGQIDGVDGDEGGGVGVLFHHTDDKHREGS